MSHRMVAKRPFRTAAYPGYPRGVHVPAGAVFDADDPAVKGREDLFVPADEWPGDVVEMATAVPGELRASRKAKK